MDLERIRAELRAVSPARATGRVRGVTGLRITAVLPGARIGDVIVVRRRGTPLLAEVVGLEEGVVVAMPLGEPSGVAADDAVESTGAPLEIRAGDGLLGRVVDGLGRPLDGGPPLRGEPVAVDRTPPPALQRTLVAEPFITGIRAIDGLLTLGVGQRIGLFSGSGVGKSTIIGSLARAAAAEVVVIALVGERGREAKELIEHALAPVLSRAVVVVATSDAPAVERLRAAQVATTVAESFRDAGKRVLLLVDSITRVARAQREVGLAAGEPPARRGYPPSVFAMLPRLLERAGPGETGSITAIYAVLVEGDDLDEPITDEVRGVLDGHIVLSRALAERHHYPAIDVPASISRTMPKVVAGEHLSAAGKVRSGIALADEKRDLVALGAYREGADAAVDRALASQDEVRRFLRQAPDEVAPFEATVAGLCRLAARYG
ncbi:MAG TPA: FliI/YscN family ATPase [Polyangiaceae bacterium]|nr:FliI/YscN family ATPase [Polyangiaceae bacterium]